MDEKLYLETDDRFDVGDETIKHTNPKAQEISDNLRKNRKEILRQFTIQKSDTETI